jgi:hypothetical protein
MKSGDCEITIFKIDILNLERLQQQQQQQQEVKHEQVW